MLFFWIHYWNNKPSYNLAQFSFDTRVALIHRVLEYEVVVHVKTAEDAGQLEREYSFMRGVLYGLSGGGSRGGACGEYHKGVFVEVGVHGGEYFLLVAASVTATATASSTTTSTSLWAASAVRSIHGGMRKSYEIFRDEGKSSPERASWTG